ncbi:MAG: DUF2752 domain-containing protein [Nitrospirae bacterium]|nr:DUF2752 domain-containing protein [Nitrospirota bacterium]
MTLLKFVSRKIEYVFFAGVTVVAGIILYRFNPENTALFPSCIFHDMTGLYCPGCGGTRALNCLLHGDIVAAFGYNQLMVVLVPVVMYVVLSYMFSSWRFSRVSLSVMWFMLAVVVLYGILRNLTPVLYPHPWGVVTEGVVVCTR